MHLNTYFNTDPGTNYTDLLQEDHDTNNSVEVPGLAESFNIPGLKPVIVKRNPSSGDQFLITDNNGNFYLWNDLDGALFRFDFKGSTKPLDEVVDMVRTEEFGSESLVQQFDKDTGPSHPSGPSGPSGGAAAAA